MFNAKRSKLVNLHDINLKMTLLKLFSQCGFEVNHMHCGRIHQRGLYFYNYYTHTCLLNLD